MAEKDTALTEREKQLEREQNTRIRVGAEASLADLEAQQERRENEFTVLSTDGSLAKVIREGKIEIIPKADLYRYEGEDQYEGMEIEDPTVVNPGLDIMSTAKDKAERSFNSAKGEGDIVNARARHAVVMTDVLQDLPEPEFDEDAYEKDREAQKEAYEKLRSDADKDRDEAEEGSPRKRAKKEGKKAKAKR